VRHLIVVGATDAVAAAICFRFSRLEYRIALLVLRSQTIDQSWKDQMQRAGCDQTITLCDLQSEIAIDQFLSLRQGEGQTTTILILMNPAEQQLPETFLANVLPTCNRVIRIQDGDSQPVEHHEITDNVGTSANRTCNTIRMRHIGSSDSNMESDLAQSAVVTESIPSLEMLNKHSGQPYEVAVLAAFLASNEAQHINGAVIDVHSGRYLS